MISPIAPLDSRTEWTSSRCTRLLRQVEVPLAALQRELCGRSQAAAPVFDKDSRLCKDSTFSRDETAQVNLEMRAVHAARKDPNDPDWIPRDELPVRKRKRYASKLPTSKKSKLMPPSSDVECSTSIVLQTPQLQRIAQAQQKPSPLPQDSSHGPETLLHGKAPSMLRTQRGAGPTRRYDAFRTAGTSSQKLCRGLLDVLSTTKTSIGPSTCRSGVPSLFSMCLRAVPNVIAHEERVSSGLPLEERWDAATDTYNFLQTLDTGLERGWKYLPVVVRAHALCLVSRAIRVGLLSADDALQLVSELAKQRRPLNSSANQVSVREIRGIVRAANEALTAQYRPNDQPRKTSFAVWTCLLDSFLLSDTYTGSQLVFENVRELLNSNISVNGKSNSVARKHLCSVLVSAITSNRQEAATASTLVKALAGLDTNVSSDSHLISYIVSILVAIVANGMASNPNEIPRSTRHADWLIRHISLDMMARQHGHRTLDVPFGHRRPSSAETELSFLCAFIITQTALHRTTEAAVARYINRAVTMLRILEKLDASSSTTGAAPLSPSQLVCMSAACLAKMSSKNELTCLRILVDPLVRFATSNSNCQSTTKAYLLQLAANAAAKFNEDVESNTAIRFLDDMLELADSDGAYRTTSQAHKSTLASHRITTGKTVGSVLYSAHSNGRRGNESEASLDTLYDSSTPVASTQSANDDDTGSMSPTSLDGSTLIDLTSNCTSDQNPPTCAKIDGCDGRRLPPPVQVQEPPLGSEASELVFANLPLQARESTLISSKVSDFRACIHNSPMRVIEQSIYVEEKSDPLSPRDSKVPPSGSTANTTEAWTLGHPSPCDEIREAEPWKSNGLRLVAKSKNLGEDFNARRSQRRRLRSQRRTSRLIQAVAKTASLPQLLSCQG